MGSGYRTFTAGEVLTASNVQNFLQDQAVMVFAGTAARSSAIGTANFEEGMLTYLTDVDKLQVYTGATFADVYPAAASTQGLTLINTTSFSGVSSQSFGSDASPIFSSTYTNYKIVFDGEASGQVSVRMRLRANTTDASGSNYNTQEIRAQGASLVTERYTNATSGDVMNTHNSKMGVEIIIFNPFGANSTVFISNVVNQNEGARAYQYFGAHTLANSYNGFTLLTSSGTITGTVSIYGLAK